MLAKNPARSGDTGLEQVVAQHILQRTWSRIHRLRVELVGGRVIVHGCTASYHAKQLALAGALEVLDSMPVDLDIQVGSGGSRRDPTRDGYWANA